MLPAVTLAAALNDGDLFAPLFPKKTWRAWRVFLSAFFGQPLSAADLALYRHHTGRAKPPSKPFREAALVIGRRGGKSRVLGLIATYVACFIDYSPYLAPGETPVVAIIAADRRQARVLLRYVVGTLRAVPMLAGMIDGDPLAESVTLSNGVVIEIHTGTIGAPRGRTFVAVLGDESAHWKTDDAAANPDTEVIAAVRPGLASIPNSVLLIASSPYAKRGLLWNTFKRHWGHDSRVLVWRGTTEEMNPRIDRSIIQEAREEDPASAAAEYDAQFRDDIATFVPREIVEAAVVPGRHELPYLRGTTYFGRVDPSGGSSDSFTLAICHRNAAGVVVLDLVRERRPPFSPEGVTAEYAGTLKAFGLHRVTGDRYAGEWPREQFRKHGIEYLVGDKSASELYVDFLPLLNSGKIELLDNPRLIAQLCGLERRTARAGKDSIDHAPGAHDDLSNATAGAALLASVEARKVVISDSAMAWASRPRTADWPGGGGSIRAALAMHRGSGYRRTI
jgi:hypothetical protein